MLLLNLAERDRVDYAIVIFITISYKCAIIQQFVGTTYGQALKYYCLL